MGRKLTKQQVRQEYEEVTALIDSGVAIEMWIDPRNVDRVNTYCNIRGRDFECEYGDKVGDPALLTVEEIFRE